MTMFNKKQKMIVLISSIFIELVLGTVYAYSIIRVQLENHLNLGNTLSSVPYLTSLAVFALLVMLSGRIMKIKDFYKWIIAGVLLIGIGYLISGVSNNYYLFTIGYGLFIGTGVGILYGIPIQVVQHVFTNNQGLAIGIAVAGFGLSTVFTAPLLQMLFDSVGFTTTLLYFGLGSVVILLISLYGLLHKIKTNEMYEEVEETTLEKPGKLFTLFFIIFMFGIMFGLSMIGLTGYIGVNQFNLTMDKISVLMTVFALSNGLSRPLFGLIYDKLKLKISVIFISVITLGVSLFYLLSNSSNEFLFIITLTLSWGTVGGWLALMPLITKDLFGVNNFKRNFGNMFLSYGLAAVIGNLYIGAMIDSSITLNLVFVPVIVLSILTIVIISLLKIKK